jgi:hypothetical protein
VADCCAETRAEESAAVRKTSVVLCECAITTLALQTDSTTRQSLSKTKSYVSRHNQARTLTLRTRHHLRDSFFTRAEQALVGSSGGVQDVDVHPFSGLRSDNDVPVFGGRTSQHVVSEHRCVTEGAHQMTTMWAPEHEGSIVSPPHQALVVRFRSAPPRRTHPSTLPSIRTVEDLSYTVDSVCLGTADGWRRRLWT